MTQVGEGISVPGVDPPDEPTDPPEEEEERVKIRISLFFDGTLNNRSNVQHRQINSSTFQKHTKSGSYQNDLSNIARMEDHLLPASDYDHSTNFYIEGIGTDNDVGDSTRGAALGTGSTGVEAKVARGIHQIVVFVQNTLARGIIIEKLTLDSFGFSRGAAAARNFVYAIRKRLKSEYISGHKVEELDIGFVGLYDTVAAHGVIHRNDTYDLSLDAIKHARAVLQLAAADEYRDNFSLTNIDSAGGKGRQAFLPGAHSDIGGGYVDDDNENKTLCTGIAKSQSLAKMLKEQDWYNDAEMILVSEIIPTGHGAVDASSLSVRRNNIHNTYSYIPLHIMADKAVENGINIRGTLKSTYTIPGVLGSIKGELEAHAKGGAYSSPTSWQKSWPIRLYHDYLHFSGSTSLGMGVRFSGGKPLRRIYKG